MMKIDIEKIKRLRIENKISLDKMAVALGYKSPTGYYYLEKGRCAVNAVQLPIIAKMLGINDIRDLYVTIEPTEPVDKL